MTARTAPVPPRFSPPHPASRHASDRPEIWIAFLIAGLVHLGALLLPLPSLPHGSPGADDREPAIELTAWKIPAPALPLRPIVAAPTPLRRIPFPVPDLPAPVPLDEPAPGWAVESVNDPGPLHVGREWSYAPAPPQTVVPLDESAECLELPVPLEGRAEPVYPRMAMLVNARGVVVLRAVISADGEVSQIEVLRAPRPDLGFSEAAVAAVSDWRYRPGTCHGRPVAVYMTVYVEFDLR